MFGLVRTSFCTRKSDIFSFFACENCTYRMQLQKIYASETKYELKRKFKRWAGDIVANFHF